MGYEYEKKWQINYTELDKNLRLSLFHAAEMAQNMVTEYFATFNSDNLTVKRENNAVWVLTKSKFHFYEYPTWKDEIYAKTYTTQLKIIRSGVEILFKNKDDMLFFIAKYEFCPIDLETRKVRKISTVNYPEDMDVRDPIFNEEYPKLTQEFNEESKVYSQKISLSDIDFSCHTNNTVYIRYLMDCFSSDFMENHIITDFEIHYLTESREGDILNFYKIENNDNTIDFLIKNDKEISRAKLRYLRIK